MWNNITIEAIYTESKRNSWNLIRSSIHLCNSVRYNNVDDFIIYKKKSVTIQWKINNARYGKEAPFILALAWFLSERNRWETVQVFPFWKMRRRIVWVVDCRGWVIHLKANDWMSEWLVFQWYKCWTVWIVTYSSTAQKKVLSASKENPTKFI